MTNLDPSETMDFDAQDKAREDAVQAKLRYENQMDSDYLWIMQSHTGRRFVWDLLLPLWRTSFDGTRIGTEFREGERNVALRVWARLQRVTPTLAHKLLEENQR